MWCKHAKILLLGERAEYVALKSLDVPRNVLHYVSAQATCLANRRPAIYRHRDLLFTILVKGADKPARILLITHNNHRSYGIASQSNAP